LGSAEVQQQDFNVENRIRRNKSRYALFAIRKVWADSKMALPTNSHSLHTVLKTWEDFSSTDPK